MAASASDDDEDCVPASPPPLTQSRLSRTTPLRRHGLHGLHLRTRNRNNANVTADATRSDPVRSQSQRPKQSPVPVPVPAPTTTKFTPRTMDRILSEDMELFEELEFNVPQEVNSKRARVEAEPEPTGKTEKCDNQGVPVERGGETSTQKLTRIIKAKPAAEAGNSVSVSPSDSGNGEAEDEPSYASGQFAALLMERLTRYRTDRSVLSMESVDSVDSVDSMLLTNEETHFFGLPSIVRRILETDRGITDLYDWQKELLSSPQVERGENVLLSLPTSGGKTLIAEVLLLQTILKKKKNCLFILPYIAIVQEKVRALATFGISLDFLVEEYAGSKGKLPPQQRRLRNSVYVATIEKACGLVHHLLKENRIDELGLVVVDEIHMLGEGSRGATLEMTLTKLMYTSGLQIVGMSATIGNLDEVGEFTKAYVYRERFRPVALKEYVVMGGKVYSPCPGESKMIHERTLQSKYSPDMAKEDPDLIGHLVLEVVPENSVLIFCATKSNCENVAKLVINAFPRKKSKEHKVKEKCALLKSLREESGGRLCQVLSLTIPFGVAYHHAGLTDDERRLIEEAFLNGVLCVICCTSTLAAGVNLPARRVILRAPFVGTEFLTRSRYKQMCGRAGRAGLDSEGESYLICDQANVLRVQSLFDGPSENAISYLNQGDGYPLKWFLLSCVVENVANTPKKLFDVAGFSLWARQAQDREAVTKGVTESLKWLVKEGLLTLKSPRAGSTVKIEDTSDTELGASDLGRAAIKGCISLDYARTLHADLVRGLDALILNTPLHLLYLLTPYDFAAETRPDPGVLYNKYQSLGAHDLRVFDRVGVSAFAIQKYFIGTEFPKEVRPKAQRLYCALMLLSVWQMGQKAAAASSSSSSSSSDPPEGQRRKKVDVEALGYQSIWTVARNYSVDRGRVQSLLARASSFGSNVLQFVQELEDLKCYADLLPSFVERIGQCSTMELVPLLQLPAVKRARARLLYDAGYKTLEDVAKADFKDIVKSVEKISNKAAKEMVTAAQMLLTESAFSLQEAAISALDVLDGFSAMKALPSTSQRHVQ